MEQTCSAQRKTVLITGGSGYLGQFVLHGLSGSCTVHYTYGSRQLGHAPAGAVGHQVDLATGTGLQAVFDQATFDLVVNAAALSQPGACEAAPDKARAVNVPTHLVACIKEQAARSGVRALLVHISTDQVYDGSHAHWQEDERCEPVNVYGRSKLEAEQFVLAELPEPHPVLALRSSIIFGPPPPDAVDRPLFLQFVVSAVSGSKPTTFFEDEWRNPVYVQDFVRLCEGLLQGGIAPRPGGPRVFNFGGPQRLSRVEMAREVAQVLQCSEESIVAAPSATVTRPVASPPDISMDVSRLAAELGFTTTPFCEALAQVLAPAAQQP